MSAGRNTLSVSKEPRLVGRDHDVLEDERREEEQLVVGEGVELVAGERLTEGHADEALEGAPHVDLRRRPSVGLGMNVAGL